MALSILTNPTDEEKAGLWDSTTNKFIFLGSTIEAEKEKHAIEEAENHLQYRQWYEEVFTSRKKELTEAGLSSEDAEQIIKIRIPKLYRAVKGRSN